jgi:hypothetical protein
MPVDYTEEDQIAVIPALDQPPAAEALRGDDRQAVSCSDFP